MRTDRQTGHRGAYEKNRKKVLATQDLCSICGKPVDKTLKNPDPMSPCIDHIIPVAKGGHPSDIDNLALAHLTCNINKSDKLYKKTSTVAEGQVLGNRNLPQSRDWTTYRSQT